VADQQACFVIMPFGQPFDRYYLNIFVPAITAVGLKPLRADSIFSSSTIMADVWRFTRQAVVVLADVTGKNPNVFYELGLAHATGKPVVIVMNSLEDVPFDLKGLRVIEYDKQNEAWGTILKESIIVAIKATLDDPERAVPAIFWTVKSQNLLKTSTHYPSSYARFWTNCALSVLNATLTLPSRRNDWRNCWPGIARY
jgi:hypothetical protein